MTTNTRWHQITCVAPKITIHSSTKRPTCQSCNASPDLDEVIASAIGTTSLPPIPPDKKLGDLNLTWPSSVPYTLKPLGSRSLHRETIPEHLSITDSKSSQPRDRRNTSPIYVHPLGENEFRLLHLNPPHAGDAFSPIHGDLKVYGLNDYPDYETVSYTWGGEDADSAYCKPIFIGAYWDILLQTKNCWSMLRLLRPESGQRAIWVDAICIDQSNYTEREDQVVQMCRIYEDSLRVFVYLGEDAVRPLGQTCSYPSRQKLQKLPRNSTNNGSLSSTDEDPLTLNNLLKRRYFSRIWVVQELLLSRSAIMRVGSTEYWIDHQTSHNITAEDPKWDWNATAAPWFKHVSQRSIISNHQGGFLDMLKLTWACQCADPRDKVFGILGLNSSNPAIRPDYFISVQDVFLGIFAHCFINLRDTRVLSYACGVLDDDDFAYPSWLPPWKRPNAFPPMLDVQSDSFKRWSHEWKQEFVLQIDRGRFENDRYRPRRGFLKLGRVSEAEGFYQKYWLKEDRDGLEVREKWDNDIFSTVQFLSIIGGPGSFERQKEEENNTSGFDTAAGILDQRSWHDIASVHAKTGSLSIPLVHLLQIQNEPFLVSQIEDMRCYRMSSESPRDDRSDSVDSISWDIETGQPTEGLSNTETSENLDVLDDDPQYIFFTTRTTNVDNFFAFGENHLFILDNGSVNLTFLILRETSTPLVFELVATCEEVLFSHICYGGNVLASDIKLSDIRMTWNMSRIFQNIATGKHTGAPAKIMGNVWLLCNAFLGKPSATDLLTILHGCQNEENEETKETEDCPDLFDLYMYSLAKVHDIEYVLEDKYRGYIQVRLDHEFARNNNHLFFAPGFARLEGLFTQWRTGDEEWSEMAYMVEGTWPGDTTKDVFVRGLDYIIHGRIREALKSLKLGLGLDEDDEEIDLSSDETELAALLWNRPWTIPSLPKRIEDIGQKFEFDGGSYCISII